MIRIADSVWSAWRVADVDEPSLPMRLTSSLPADDLVELVRGALRALKDGAGVDEYPGEWSVARAGAAVLLEVEEPDDFEWSLRAIVSYLEREGVDGEVEVWEEEPPPYPIDPAYVLDCRMRVRGERLHRGPGNWGWVADPAALEDLAEMAFEWSMAVAVGEPVALSVAGVPDVWVRSRDDLSASTRQAVQAGELVGWWTLGTESRRVKVHPFMGRISVIATIPSGEWRAHLPGLSAFLRDCSPLLAYGLIKHGSSGGLAASGYSIVRDWPPRPGGVRPKDIDLAAAFENTHAPDSFAVQLLGPGYDSGVVSGPSWRREQVGTDALLVEHVDPAAWFDHEFVPFNPGMTGHRDAVPPEVLVQAREDFARILYAREITLG
jgi:hypothetical protein